MAKEEVSGEPPDGSRVKVPLGENPDLFGGDRRSFLGMQTFTKPAHIGHDQQTDGDKKSFPPDAATRGRWHGVELPLEAGGVELLLETGGVHLPLETGGVELPHPGRPAHRHLPPTLAVCK